MGDRKDEAKNKDSTHLHTNESNGSELLDRHLIPCLILIKNDERHQSA